MSEEPKIIVNDGYVDLRQAHNPSQFKASSHVNRYENALEEKQLINSGLKKLARSYNCTNNVYSQSSKSNFSAWKRKSNFDSRFRRSVIPPHEPINFESHSEESIKEKLERNIISPSTPSFFLESSFRQGGDYNRNQKLLSKTDNKCTMTSKKSSLSDRQVASEKSYEIMVKDSSIQKRASSEKFISADYLDVPQWRNSRLVQKYSILNLSDRPSWTIPFKTISTEADCEYDRETYLYDDGTDVDSTYLANQRKYRHKGRLYLVASGTVFGLFTVALFIWVLIGNHFFDFMLKHRDPIYDTTVKRMFKFTTKSFTYLLSTIFKNIAGLIAMPIYRVYQGVHQEIQEHQSHG